jgi:hypothetical protein
VHHTVAAAVGVVLPHRVPPASLEAAVAAAAAGAASAARDKVQMLRHPLASAAEVLLQGKMQRHPLASAAGVRHRGRGQGHPLLGRVLLLRGKVA